MEREKLLGQIKNNIDRPASVVRLANGGIILESSNMNVLIIPDEDGIMIQGTNKFKEKDKIFFREKIKPQNEQVHP